MIGEAMECLGGNGYVEESVLPRLYREAPLNAIWEGSGNVICLDVLRAIAREPDALPALLAEIRLARGGDRRLDAARRRGSRLTSRDPADAELRARAIWSSGSPRRSRPRCSCAPRRPRSRTRSAPRGSRAARRCSARCRRRPTSPALLARALP